MGQRHQTFIHTLNGANALAKRQDNDKRDNKAGKLENEFGNGDTTVLAYHHQWLYGLSAAIQALHVLEFNRDAGQYSSPFKKDGIIYGGFNIGNDEISQWVNSVTALFSMFTHPMHKKLGTGRTGIERIHYLNKEEPGMRLNFDAGDNNDGISVIDTVSGKYCFMVINDYQCQDNGRNPYEILSAVEYVRDFYYPTDPEKWSGYDKERFPGEKMEAEIRRRKGNIAKLEKAYAKFHVLTPEELVKIWPNYAKKTQQSGTAAVLG